MAENSWESWSSGAVPSFLEDLGPSSADSSPAILDKKNDMHALHTPKVRDMNEARIETTTTVLGGPRTTMSWIVSWGMSLRKRQITPQMLMALIILGEKGARKRSDHKGGKEVFHTKTPNDRLRLPFGRVEIWCEDTFPLGINTAVGENIGKGKILQLTAPYSFHPFQSGGPNSAVSLKPDVAGAKKRPWGVGAIAVCGLAIVVFALVVALVAVYPEEHKDAGEDKGNL